MFERTMADPVLYQAEAGVATLTLNRPDRLNAWTRELGVRFYELLEQASEDPEVRAIVITGAGRGFCAGADMDLLQSIGGGSAVVGEQVQLYPSHMLEIPKPIIAAVNGPAAGLGFVVALMCDIRFAAAGAKLTTAFVRRGLIAEYASAWMLPRLVGPSHALDLLLSGRVVLAEEAKEMGLVHRVCPPEALLEETLAYARDLAANCSPRSMAVIKSQVYLDLDADLSHALDRSLREMEASLETEDFKEGVASYVEQRAPRFPPLGEKARSSA
jgi:enoyl-CoA hydratase/carnithine racemase